MRSPKKNKPVAEILEDFATAAQAVVTDLEQTRDRYPADFTPRQQAKLTKLRGVLPGVSPVADFYRRNPDAPFPPTEAELRRIDLTSDGDGNGDSKGGPAPKPH